MGPSPHFSPGLQADESLDLHDQLFDLFQQLARATVTYLLMSRLLTIADKLAYLSAELDALLTASLRRGDHLEGNSNRCSLTSTAASSNAPVALDGMCVLSPRSRTLTIEARGSSLAHAKRAARGLLHEQRARTAAT